MSGELVGWRKRECSERMLEFTHDVPPLCSRNHPSVVAYSIENESDESVIPQLIDVAAQNDPTRPLTTEGSGGGYFFNGTGMLMVNFYSAYAPVISAC